MVKNLPSVERSTKIRFGKHVPDSTDQEENTIVFNASNVLVPTPYSNAVYLSPIRNKSDYQAPEIVLLMYDRNTKEITESGESANALIGGVTLNTSVQRGNATSNTIIFVGGGMSDNGVAFVTDPESSNKVGIANLNPQHTVSVGSNLYIDDVGSNVLVVSGNVAILDSLIVEGNLTVNGGTTVIVTENLSIGDAIIELGRNNTSGDTTLDLGILMHRPDALSNVVIGFRESSNEFAIAYTEASPYDKTFTPLTSEDINVHVYGLTHVDANIYAHEDVLVTGNAYITGNVVASKDFTLTGNTYITGNVVASKDFTLTGNTYITGNVVAYKDFTLTGNAYVSGNISVIEELTISNNVYADKDLEVLGNTYITGNVVASKDFTLTGNAYVSGNISIIEELTISNNVYADKDLEVLGNTYITGNVVAYKDFTLTGNAYVSGNVSITEELTITGNVYADKDLEVLGNTYITGNVTIDSTTLHVDTETNRVGLGTITPKSTLDIVGNVYVTSNISTASNVLITGTAAATSKTTGALQVTGGVGIQGDLYATHANLEDVEADSLTVTDTTHSTSKDTGVLVVTQGGLGVEANIHSTNVFAASHIGVGTSATSNTFDVRGTANVGALVTTSTHISDSTTASTKSSGALQVTGGAGIQGTLFAADTTLDSVKVLNMSTGTLPFTDANKKLVNSLITQNDDGSITISGNMEIAGNISVVGNTFALTSNNVIITDRILDLANNNASSSLDIGILMEHPGKNIFIGHHTNPHDHFSIGYTDAGYTADQVEWNGTDHITANIWGHLITQNTVTVQYGNVYIVDGGLGIGIGDGENDDVPDSKLYVTGNAHFTSNISTASNVLVTGDAGATSKTTGALQVTGGVGIGENIFVGGTGKIENDTDASSTTTGALQVLGGLGVVKSIHAADTTFESVNITDNTNSTDKDTGALIVQSGGAGIELNLNVGGVTKVWDGTDATTTTSGAVQVVGGLGVAKTLFAADVSSGSVIVTDNTTSTTTTSGALKVAGGVGIVENLNVGGVTKVWDGTNATNTTTGALKVVGGLGVAKTIFAADLSSGSVIVTDNTTSDSATTGALKVTGGVSTQENLNVGGTGKIWDGTNATTTTSGALQVVGGLGVAKTIFAADLSSGSVIVTDTTTSDSATTGALKVAGGISTQENLNVGGVTKVWDGTNATDTTTGALQVVGGLGVAKTIFAADLSSGSVIVSDGTTSTTKDTGALIVTTGGVGVEENLNVGGVTKVWDGTNATDTTTGALQVVGGLGVAKTIFAADMSSGSVDVTDTTEATDTLTGTLTVAGGISTQTNVHAANVYISGGLITNTAGVTKKTYSQTGTITTETTPGIAIVFSDHAFSAKITAQLIESDIEISTLFIDVTGGRRGGASTSTLNIAKGPLSIFGDATSNPWSTTVGATTTTVTLTPSTNLNGEGHYNIFVEYVSADTGGSVSTIGGTSTGY